MKRNAVGVLASLVFCAFSFADQAERLPLLPKNHLHVPIFRQATDFSCGAAAVASVLTYWNLFDGGESELYQKLETDPAFGTHPETMTKVLSEFHLSVEMLTNQTLLDLEIALAAGKTAILDIQAWSEDESAKLPWPERWNDGHYVILIGMDDQYVYVMDPSIAQGYGYIPREELLMRWHDYEDRTGKIKLFLNLAIYVKGAQPLTNYPAKLIRVE